MKISELHAIFLRHPVVTTDSRMCPKNSIFFALKGERFNGNLFASEALKAGCAYAVVDETCLLYTSCRLLLPLPTW